MIEFGVWLADFHLGRAGPVGKGAETREEHAADSKVSEGTMGAKAIKATEGEAWGAEIIHSSICSFMLLSIILSRYQVGVN